MSIRITAAVWNHTKAKSGDLVVLLALADFSNDQGLAYPSIPTLARKARLSPRQVKRAIDSLHRLGELNIYKKKGPNGVNRYMVLLGDKLSPPKGLKVTSATGDGDILGKKVVTPMSPNPSEESVMNLREENEWKIRISETVLGVMNKWERAGLGKGSC